MRRRSGVIFLLFGLILAALVGASVLKMADQAQARSTQIETVEMLVVTQDVPERTVLTPAMVTVRRTVPEARPAGALTHPDQIAGRMTKAALFAGEPVLSHKLADTDGKSGVAYTLEPGQVVITFPASDILTTGAIRVGDHVDLLVTLLPETESNERITTAATNQGGTTSQAPSGLPQTTQLTMQNLRVIGIGSVESAKGVVSANANNRGGQLITFAVNHQDALILKALKDSGRAKVEMVLRAAGDDQVVRTDPVTIQRLIEQYGFRGQPVR